MKLNKRSKMKNNVKFRKEVDEYEALVKPKRLLRRITIRTKLETMEDSILQQENNRNSEYNMYV
jgi:hypothetical protein